MPEKTQLLKSDETMVQSQEQQSTSQQLTNRFVPNSTEESTGDLVRQVYEAFSGLGTDEQAVHRVLNLPHQQLKMVIAQYEATYKEKFIPRLRDEMKSFWSDEDWQFAAYQLKTAGFGAYLPKETATNFTIKRSGIKSSHTRKAVYPGDRVSYQLNQNYDSYQWYAVNDFNTTEAYDKKNGSMTKGSSAAVGSFKAGFPGSHKIVCKASKKGQAPIFYEFQQEVHSYAEELGVENVSFEYLAHFLAYKDEDFINQGQTNSPSKSWQQANKILRRMGYDLRTAHVYHGRQDFDAVRIQPLRGLSKNPVIAFRGTQPTHIEDITTDLNPVGVGFDQMYKNVNLILQIIKDAGGKADFTGHSLGGALAQYAAAYYPGVANRVVTFQAPGIDKESAAQFARQKNRPQVTHNIADNDVVDLAGGSHLQGDVYRHELNSWFTHTDYMFVAPQFKSIRQQLGLTDTYLEKELEQNADFPAFKTIRKYDEYPHPIKSTIVESLRQLGSSGFRKIYEQIRKSKFKRDIAKVQQQLRNFQKTRGSK